MKRKAVCGIVLMLLLTNMLSSTFIIQPVKAASGTIYIRADGSVDPPTAPIQRDGDTYTFTANIYDKIVVQRSNATIDGATYVLQGYQSGYGFSLSGVSNVTIKRTHIEQFALGIYINESFAITITNTNVTNNYYGVELKTSSNDIIHESSIVANEYDGVRLLDSSYNNIFGNTITNNGRGISLYGSSDNNFYENTITNNSEYGVSIPEPLIPPPRSINNNFFSNNLVGGRYGIYLSSLSLHNSLYLNSIANSNQYGIYAEGVNHTISGNNITNTYRVGVCLWESSKSIVSANNIVNSGSQGLWLNRSPNNTVIGNKIMNNAHGIILHGSSNNIIHGNNMSSNTGDGIFIGGSRNKIYHNNFINNTRQAYSAVENNLWDNGYPSGGNYWSDYNGTDLFSGPYQNETGSDDIGDTLYFIEEYDVDRYPLMKPRTPLPTPDFSIAASPTALTIQQDNSDTSVITIKSVNSFHQPVQLAVSGAPSGVTTTLTPEQITPPPDASINSTLTVLATATTAPGNYTLTVTGTSGALTHTVDISLEITTVPPPPNQPPTCFVKLQKDGVEIDEIGVGEFFDIYVGGSIDDTGIMLVRFSSDDFQDDNPTGEWTDWYDWDISSEDWNASTKIKRWAFATGGDKEVWAEVKDDIGQTAKSSANIYAIGPPPTDTTPPDTKIIDGPGGTIDDNDVTFTWTGSDDVTSVSELVYSYYLEGYDSDWSDWTLETSKQYIDLPNGDYTFKVKAKDQAGNTDPTPDERSFTISITGPHIDSITPSSGAPGIEVTIKGLNFEAHFSQWVDFGGQQITTNIISWSDKEVVIKVPHPSGPEERVVDVRVVPDMEESNPIEFTYSVPFINWIHPSSGRPGEEVTINGKDFGYKDFSPSFWVMFGKSPAYSPTWMDTEIVAEAPSDYGTGEQMEDVLYWLIKFAIGYYEDIPSLVLDIIEELLSDGVEIPPGEGEIHVNVRVHTPVGYSNVAVFTYVVDEFLLADLLSPGELRIYDSQGRVTGLMDGQVKEEIPYSYYVNNSILIVYPSDSYRYEVAGTEEGAYGLRITSGKVGEATTFTATSIPTSSNAIHQYTIDWTALSQGEEGVTVKVDSDGDGTFEETFTADSELTRDEFVLKVPPVEAFPMWIAGAAVATIAIATVAIAVFWRRRKQPPTKG